MIYGDMECAILEKVKAEYGSPSEAAKAGRWDLAELLAKEWDEDYAEELADAVEALWPNPMSCLDGFDHTSRREAIEADRQESEAKATLREGLKWLDEQGFELDWLPESVKKALIQRRIDALVEWGEQNPETA